MKGFRKIKKLLTLNWNYKLRRAQIQQSCLNLKCNLWNTPDLFFLHIGKTGGTYIKTQVIGNSDYLKGGVTVPLSRLFKRNHRIIPLKHTQSQLQNFRPGIDLLSCWIREPIQRIHSAFDFAKNRQFTMYRWVQLSENEAKLLAKFENFEKFIKKLVIDCDPEAKELICSMDHFKMNYEYYFESVEVVKKYESNFVFVGQMEQMASSIELFCSITNISSGHQTNQTVNKTATKYRTASIDGHLLNAARDYFKIEYDIYNFLLSISNRMLRKRNKQDSQPFKQ